MLIVKKNVAKKKVLSKVKHWPVQMRVLNLGHDFDRSFKTFRHSSTTQIFSSITLFRVGIGTTIGIGNTC